MADEQQDGKQPDNEQQPQGENVTNEQPQFPKGIELNKDYAGFRIVTDDPNIRPHYKSGGYSFVFPCRRTDDKKTSGLHALKIMNIQAQPDASLKEDLYNETSEFIRLMTGLESPNLRRLIAHSEVEQDKDKGCNPFMVLSPWVDYSIEEFTSEWRTQTTQSPYNNPNFLRPALSAILSVAGGLKAISESRVGYAEDVKLEHVYIRIKRDDDGNPILQNNLPIIEQVYLIDPIFRNTGGKLMSRGLKKLSVDEMLALVDEKDPDKRVELYQKMSVIRFGLVAQEILTGDSTRPYKTPSKEDKQRLKDQNGHVPVQVSQVLLSASVQGNPGTIGTVSDVYANLREHIINTENRLLYDVLENNRVDYAGIVAVTNLEKALSKMGYSAILNARNQIDRDITDTIQQSRTELGKGVLSGHPEVITAAIINLESKLRTEKYGTEQERQLQSGYDTIANSLENTKKKIDTIPEGHERDDALRRFSNLVTSLDQQVTKIGVWYEADKNKDSKTYDPLILDNTATLEKIKPYIPTEA